MTLKGHGEVAGSSKRYIARGAKALKWTALMLIKCCRLEAQMNNEALLHGGDSLVVFE